MENKLNLSNLLDLLESTDREKISSYSNFLRCYKCQEYLLEPKNCIKCGYTICGDCKKCSHEVTQSRHIKALLDSLVLKCKYGSSGCDENIKYTDLKKHLESCKFFKGIYSPNKENSQSSMARGNSFDKSKEITYNEFAFVSSDKLFNTSVDEYERDGVKCSKCSLITFNKIDYINHFKICFGEEAASLANMNKIGLMDGFQKSQEEACRKFLDFMYLKTEQNKNNAINYMENIFSELQSKREFIKNCEKILSQTNNENIMRDDKEYLMLITEEEELRRIREELNSRLQSLNNNNINFIKQSESKLKEEVKSRRDELMMLEVAEKWAREDLESSYFDTDFGEKCAQCGNEDSRKKKYFCQNCNEKYCIEDCAKKCKNCPKFICPKDGKKCKLCHNTNFCESCQKKCFYVKCENTFCPECYKRNEHQARSETTNCKLFTCEKDGTCDCLMTSIFCSKCEKRLCNNCLRKDKEHFPFIR